MAYSPAVTSRSLAGGQFKATKMWNDLVYHLYENASVKKRRVMMRSHGDCFSGGNAVDTLLSYVQRNPNKFPNTPMVTRENIARLCQSFLDANVFECVNAGEDSEKKTKFEDSSSRLYRFDQKTKREFMRENVFRRSSLSLNSENLSAATNDVEHLHAKFSGLLTPSRSTEPAPRRKMFSSFSMHSCGKSITTERHMIAPQTSDSDSENQKPITRRSMKLKRNRSFIGRVVKRSSSDSNLQKRSSTSSESDSKRGSPGGALPQTKLRLSQRLSLRKKPLRSPGHSSYNLQQPCVLQNHTTSQTNRPREVKQKYQGCVLLSSNAHKVDISSKNRKERNLTKEEILHVKRESIRVRLLQIFDVPFVETLVISPPLVEKTRTLSQTVNMHSGMQYSEVAASYNSDDPWISSCLSVLQHIPDSYDILRKYARSQQPKKKAELYLAVADHYNSLEQPLLDENYNGIAQAIISQLESKPVDKMMEAVQLFVHLLSGAKLIELSHLCEFLHNVCAQSRTKMIQTGGGPKQVIETFTPAILRLPGSASLESGLDGCQGLVRFIIQHRLLVFTLPPVIEVIIRRKIELLEQGLIESPSLVSDTIYCSIISDADYQSQRVTHTLAQMQELFDQIQSSSSLTAKKKKDLLKKLQRQHPDVFETNSDDSEKSSNDKTMDRSLQQTRLLLNLSHPKQERKLGSSSLCQEKSATNDPKNTGSGKLGTSSSCEEKFVTDDPRKTRSSKAGALSLCQEKSANGDPQKARSGKLGASGLCQEKSATGDPQKTRSGKISTLSSCQEKSATNGPQKTRSRKLCDSGLCQEKSTTGGPQKTKSETAWNSSAPVTSTCSDALNSDLLLRKKRSSARVRAQVYKI